MDESIGYRKMNNLIDRIQRDEYARPLADVLTLLEKYAFRFFEDAETLGNEHNTDVAYTALRNITRVIPSILKEEHPSDAAKSFTSTLLSYLQDNWQQQVAA